MNPILARSSLAAAVLALVLFGCGGGDDNTSAGGTQTADAANGGTPTQTFDPNVLGQECLPAPVAGAKRQVSASWIVPVEVDVVDIAGLGSQTFGGKSYPAMDVRNSRNVFFGGDQHHAVYLVPETPVLAAGAITYAKAGSGESDSRYRIDYAATTLSDLLAKRIFPAVQPGGGPVPWDSATRARVAMTTPVLAGLGMGQSRTYVMFKQSDFGTGTYQRTYGGTVTELTFTYQGRENVAASDGTYAQACKVVVDARRIHYNWRNGGNAEIQNAYRGTVWLAPNVGPVRVALTDAEQNVPVLDVFLPAAR